MSTTTKIKLNKLNFEDLKKQFNWVYSWLENNEKCKDFILSQPSKKEEEVVLYYPGKTIPGGKDIYKHFEESGYEVIPSAHPSILVNFMKNMTDKDLDDLGLPSWANIILPTSEDSLLPGEDGCLCFLYAFRYDGGRKLCLTSFNGEWSVNCAFLLNKKTLSKLEHSLPHL